MAVVSFMSKDGSKIVCLDATTDVTYKRSNSSTQHSVMSGANISDTYRIGNPTISFSGMCTYSKGLRQKGNPTPKELEKLINELVESYTRVNLLGNSLIPSLNDCVILDFSVHQADYLDAVMVDITLKQQFISNRAVVTTVKAPSKSTKGSAADNKNGGSGKKSQADLTKYTTAAAIEEFGFSGVLGGILGGNGAGGGVE